MKVRDIGEFGLIARLSGVLAQDRPPELIVGIGDDGAVWRAGDQYLVATTDTMVEGVHFFRGAGWEDVGWKALAVNVSDISAMGARSLFALVTLALPPDTAVDEMEALYRGLRDCSAEYSVTIAGGDVVSAPQVSITVALLGAATLVGNEPALLRRSAATPGDGVAVSGTLGDSAGGLRQLESGGEGGSLVRAHSRPCPPAALGPLAAGLGLRCGIDISDGLLQDLGHVCEASGAGAVLHASLIPVSGELQAAYPGDALGLACTGGEDYQLVLVGDLDLIERVRRESTVPLTVVGEIIRGASVRLRDESGAEIDLGPPGWDHLRRGRAGTGP